MKINIKPVVKTTPKGLEIFFEVPDNLTPEQIQEVIEHMHDYFDEKYKDLGGDGFDIKKINVESL